MNNTAIVRNIQTNDLYRHIEDNQFKNIRTGVIGNVPPDKAQKAFQINLEATLILNSNPNIEKLINVLGLSITK